MNENTDSRKLEISQLFTLEVKVPDHPTKKLEVVDRILAGIDPRNDLILIDPVIKTKHLLFRKRNNVLTVHYLGKEGDTTLNGHSLEKGKLYILEKGDLLKMGAIQILIHRQSGLTKIQESEEIINMPLTEEIEVNEPEIEVKEVAPTANKNILLIPNQAPKIKIIGTKREPIFNFTTLKLIPYKFYGFLIDIAFTYFALSFIIPYSGFLQDAQDLIFPIDQFVYATLLSYYPPLTELKILSLVEFFVPFHAIMIASSLILGTTPGAFIIGLHSKPGRSSFLGMRFKAYLYALLNIVALPFLVFDFPFYKGRTIKEILTFSERENSTSGFFKILQKIVVPTFILITLIAPLFLPDPFMPSMSESNIKNSKIKEVHTTELFSESHALGISLQTELANQYKLLPYLEKKKWGMILYDLTSGTFLTLKEEKKISLAMALFQLRYANPFASLIIANDQMSSLNLKLHTLNSLQLSLEKIPDLLQHYGPFFANIFLFKNIFLNDFNTRDSFVFIAFDKQNPALRIASGKEERLLLFTKKNIFEFSIVIPKKSKLLEIFSTYIASGLKFSSTHEQKTETPQMFEVFESLDQGKTETILTYYINEVKKAQELNNPTWNAFLKKNLLQTKMALDGVEKRKTEKTFDELINSLN